MVSSPVRELELRTLTTSSTMKDIRQLRVGVQAATGLFVATALAGSIVAGIDAGKAFNSFPKMNGDKWLPDHLFELSPTTRNFFENIGLTQLDHRALAVGTLAAYSAVYYLARKGDLWHHLPSDVRTALNLTMVAVGGQAIGGITAVKHAVPLTLALVHQSGAALILASSLWTLHMLRFAKPVGAVQAAAKAAAKAL